MQKRNQNKHWLHRVAVLSCGLALAGCLDFSGVGNGEASGQPVSVSSAGNLTPTPTPTPNPTILGTLAFLTGSPMGSGPGAVDGSGTATQFNTPQGMTIDASGNLYVTDSRNHTIRKITPAGVVSTFAGAAGQAGSNDGSGAAARFTTPQRLTSDARGNLYITDSGAIRKITPAGVVSTLAGTVGQGGSTDGSGAAARFNFAQGVAVDASGNLYIADSNNHTIRKITPTGVVSTFAGAAGQPGTNDGSGAVARFNFPKGLTIDASGNLYVADRGNATIRKITPTGVVSTHAGAAGQFGNRDGSSTIARFGAPEDLIVDPVGNIYISDDYTLRKIDLTGVVSTLAGATSNPGTDDGTGVAARFGLPEGLALDASGNLYVADSGNHTVRKINPAGTVSTLAGNAAQRGSSDGSGAVARFFEPAGIAFDTGGNLYIADSRNQTIRKIDPTGVTSTLAGSAGQFGSNDGSGAVARFGTPNGLAIDATGNLYVADSSNSKIRKITPAGIVSTLAGGTSSGSRDGSGATAQFSYPTSLAIDLGGNVYVADSGNHTIRKIDPAGVVTTLAGSAGQSGSSDGNGAAARFNFPKDLAIDGGGNLYVADHGNGTIRTITPTGLVSTYAGTAAQQNVSDGTGVLVRFSDHRLTLDPIGNLYVTDGGPFGRIRKIAPDGEVRTIAGFFSLNFPSGIAFRSVNGIPTLYVTESKSHRIVSIALQ